MNENLPESYHRWVAAPARGDACCSGGRDACFADSLPPRRFSRAASQLPTCVSLSVSRCCPIGGFEPFVRLSGEDGEERGAFFLSHATGNTKHTHRGVGHPHFSRFLFKIEAAAPSPSSHLAVFSLHHRRCIHGELPASPGTWRTLPRGPPQQALDTGRSTAGSDDWNRTQTNSRNSIFFEHQRIYGLTRVYTRLLSEVASIGLEIRVAGKDDGVKAHAKSRFVQKACCELAKIEGTYETYPGSPVSKGILQPVISLDARYFRSASAATWVKWVNNLAQGPTCNSVTLNRTHQDDLGGPDGQDALGMDQTGVSQVIKATFAEDLGSGLEPYGLTELDTIAGQELWEDTAKSSKHGPSAVDHLKLAVLCKCLWIC
ncbi:hypothetical protein LXL04_002491 [Taraxacum kok-saghyz]